MGDGSCLLNSRANSLEGSTPSPSATGNLGDRLTVGRQSLKLPVKVRPLLPEPWRKLARPHGRSTQCVGRHWRAQAAVTRPRKLCRFDSCPTHSRPVRRSVMPPLSQGGQRSSTLLRATGPRPTCGSFLQSWPGGGIGRHAALKRPCRHRHEGSSPSLATDCPYP